MFENQMVCRCEKSRLHHMYVASETGIHPFAACQKNEERRCRIYVVLPFIGEGEEPLCIVRNVFAPCQCCKFRG